MFQGDKSKFFFKNMQIGCADSTEKQIHLNKKKDVTDTDGIRHLYISIPVTPDRSIDNHEQDELYYSKIVSQLKLYINNLERMIFYINILDNLRFITLLRSTFDCRIVTTVHSINWGFFVFENLPQLRQIMNDTCPGKFDERMKSLLKKKNLYSCQSIKLFVYRTTYVNYCVRNMVLIPNFS